MRGRFHDQIYLPNIWEFAYQLDLLNLRRTLTLERSIALLRYIALQYHHRAGISPRKIPEGLGRSLLAIEW